MSNLVNFGDFSSPSLNNNSFLSGQTSLSVPFVGWTNTVSSAVSLCNGIYQGFISPGVGNQYVYIVGINNFIQQTVYFDEIGTYSLSLKYASSTSYNSSSNLKIFLDVTQLYNIVSTSLAWNTFNLQMNITSVGPQVLKF